MFFFYILLPIRCALTCCKHLHSLFYPSGIRLSGFMPYFITLGRPPCPPKAAYRRFCNAMNQRCVLLPGVIEMLLKNQENITWINRIYRIADRNNCKMPVFFLSFILFILPIQVNTPYSVGGLLRQVLS